MPQVARERVEGIDLAPIVPECHKVTRCTKTGRPVDALHVVQNGNTFEIEVTCHGIAQYRSCEVPKTESPLMTLVALAQKTPFCTEESLASAGTGVVVPILPAPTSEDVHTAVEAVVAAGEKIVQTAIEAWRDGFAAGFKWGSGIGKEKITPETVALIVEAVAKGPKA